MTEEKRDSAVLSDIISMDDIITLKRKPSEHLLKNWENDFITNIKRGQSDIKSDVITTEIGVDNLNEYICGDNECIIILPKSAMKNINNSMESSSDDNNDASKVKAYKLPLLKPTMGHSVIDIRQLYKKTGVTTYDPGFMSTSSCHSQITYIDGANVII